MSEWTLRRFGARHDGGIGPALIVSYGTRLGGARGEPPYAFGASVRADRVQSTMSWAILDDGHLPDPHLTIVKLNLDAVRRDHRASVPFVRPDTPRPFDVSCGRIT